MEQMIMDEPATPDTDMPDLEQPAAMPPAEDPPAEEAPPTVAEPPTMPENPPSPATPPPARQETPPAGAEPEEPPADEPEEPPAPPTTAPAPGASENKRRYWRSILTGNPATVPTEVRRKSGVDEWDLPEEKKEYRLLSTVNRSWAADHLERTPEYIRTHWKRERAELARRLQVRNNEQEVFLALSQEAEDEPRREASKRIYEQYYMAGLNEQSRPDVPMGLDELSDEDRENALQLAQDSYAQGRKMREELHGLAERLAHGMDAFAAVEEDAVSAPRVLMAAPDLLNAVDALADMDEPRRRTALYLAAGMLRNQAEGAEPASLLGRVTQAARRGAANLAMGVAQGISHAGIAVLNNMNRLMESETLSQTTTAWEKRMRVLNELRHLSQEELRPLVPPGKEGSAESYLTTAAEAVPAALLSCCGGAGFTALTLGAVGDSVAEARARAPLADHELQLYAGLLAGSIQAGIYMNLNRLGGRLLEQSIARIGRAGGKSLADYGLAGLNVMGGATADMAAMLTAGKLAGAADLGAQEMAARLSRTASNIDWKAFGDNLTDIEANLHEAAGLLPFLLLGSGRLALQHFRSPRAILGDGSQLVSEWGISPEELKAIMEEPRLETQSELLQRALRNSKLWNDLNSSRKALRAMNLLNSDGFGEFSNPERVCDFLRLPAPAHEIVSNPQGEPPMDVAQAGGNKHRVAVWDMWNEWWKLSRVSEPGWMQLYRKPFQRFTAPARALPRGVETQPELLNELRKQVPPALQKNTLTYDMGTEEARAALLDERITDLKSLSYLMLLNTHSVDSLERSVRSVPEIRARADSTRQAMMMAVGRAVASLGSGISRQEAMKKLNDDMSRLYLRHRGKTTSSEWLRAARPDTLTRMISNPSKHDTRNRQDKPNMQQFLRIMTGVQANTEALMELLPDSQEFQAALVRGIPLVDIFTGMVSKHLDLPEEALRKSIKIKSLLNATPMEEYAQQNQERFRVYSQLTGYELTSTVGDDNCRYIRTTRPDGSATLWHADEQTAINDLVGNASLAHLPLLAPTGKEASDYAPGLYTAADEGSYNLLNREPAEYREYSKYDQQCSAAMYHLGAAWMENATGLQPGLFVEKKRSYLYENDKEDFTRPLITGGGKKHVVELLSESTPLSMIESRAAVFWDRLLQSGYVTPEQMGDYLVSKQYMTREECAEILGTQAPPAYYRREHIRHNRVAHRERHAGSQRTLMLQKMVDYTGLNVMARLQELPLPQEVKNWVGMAAFCPEPPPLLPTAGAKKGAVVRFGQDGTQTVSRANRRVAQRMREIAPRISELRQSLSAPTEADAPAAHMDGLLDELMGKDDAMSYEKGWCHRAGGVSAVHGVPQAYWNVLRSPLRAWQTMGEKQQTSLRRHLEPFCLRVPEYTGRAEQDPVEVALESLDTLLREHPEMHRYTLVGQESALVREMELVSPSREFMHQLDFLRPMPIYRGNRPVGAGYRVGSDTPLAELMDDDPRIPVGMALLDKLRSWEIDLPSVDSNGIWWKGELYGGAGKWPAGLSPYDFTAEKPLGAIVSALQDISKYNARGKQMEICGIKMRGLSKDADLSPLQNITLYRSRRYPTHVLRLMPGDTTLENSVMRTPYLVHCSDGVYVHNNRSLREADEMDLAYMPLHEAAPVKPRHYVSRNKVDWRQQGMRHSLNMLRELPCSTPEEIPANSARILEVLMRMGEDSGFSQIMRTAPLQSLHPRELRLLNLMGDMISVLCTAQPGEALQHMQQVLPLLHEKKKPENSAADAPPHADKPTRKKD